MSAQETVVEPVTTETIPATPESATEIQTPNPEAVETDEATEQERDDKGRFKPNRVQERIDELTRQKGESAREAAYWRGVAEAAKPAVEAKPAEDPGKPKPEGFATYDEYIEKLTDWKIEQREQVRGQKQREQETASNWNQRATAARQSMPDFDAVLSSSAAPMTKAMAETIQDSDKGPELAYHLAKNPAEAARIAQLGQLATARELGKLEAFLSAPKPAPKTTSAPNPPTPIGSGRSTEGDPGKMPMSEYLAWRETQFKGKR